MTSAKDRHYYDAHEEGYSAGYHDGCEQGGRENYHEAYSDGYADGATDAYEECLRIARDTDDPADMRDWLLRQVDKTHTPEPPEKETPWK